MTAEPTTLASWTRALRKQLDALGLDSAALCREAGLDPTVLDDPNARCPLSVTTRLWQLAVAASGDPALGLKTSQFVSPTTFHALGYALIASSSLREMFERIVRYHRVVSDALQLELRELEDVYEFRFRVPPGSPAPAPEALDAFAAIYVRSCRNRLNREFSPLLVQLQRPQPTDPAPGRRYFAHRCSSMPRKACCVFPVPRSSNGWTTATRSWPNTTRRCSDAAWSNCRQPAAASGCAIAWRCNCLMASPPPSVSPRLCI